MADDSKVTILCVDDEQDIVDSLFDTFMDSYNVKTACSGADALKIFDEEDIAVVITDQRMPEMEGTELLEKIHEKKTACKKILLTGYADINAAIDAINKGSVDKYFSKPWDDDELTRAVEHLVSMYDFDKFLNQMENDGDLIKREMNSVKSASIAISDFFDNYHMGVCIFDADDRAAFLNKKGCSLLNYSNPSGITGMGFKDVFPVDLATKKEFQRKLSKGKASPSKIDARESDGTKTELIASLVFDAEEGSDKVCGVVFMKE